VGRWEVGREQPYQWGNMGNGKRNAGFHVGNCEVLVQPSAGDHNDEALELARGFLASTEHEKAFKAASDERLAFLHSEVSRLKARERELLGRIPPERPGQLMGRGYVRFTGAGQLWLLGNREKGWGHFGFHMGTWDNLFRRWNVTVVDFGNDEHGPWWAVENFAEPSTSPGTPRGSK
jgi:hypothetical protein